MAINPRPPVVDGPIKFDYRYSDDTGHDEFVAPVHLPVLHPDGIRKSDQELDQELDQKKRTGSIPEVLPDDDLDTTHDPTESLPAESVPEIWPAFLGLRKKLIDQRIEKADAKLNKLKKRQEVIRYVGESILTNNSNYLKLTLGEEPNLKRPSTRQELRATKKLHKTTIKRRQAQSLVHSTSHNKIPDDLKQVSRAEKKSAKKSSKLHDKAEAKASKLDSRFKKIIEKPAKQAKRVTARRNRLVARQEAIQRLM